MLRCPPWPRKKRLLPRGGGCSDLRVSPMALGEDRDHNPDNNDSNGDGDDVHTRMCVSVFLGGDAVGCAANRLFLRQFLISRSRQGQGKSTGHGGAPRGAGPMRAAAAATTTTTTTNVNAVLKWPPFFAGRSRTEAGEPPLGRHVAE